MDHSRITKHSAVLTLLVFWVIVGAYDSWASEGALPARSFSRLGHPRITKAITEAPKQWVERELAQGHEVVLTNSYLFQVMKGIAQENQKAAEETLLIPLLRETLKGLFHSASDPDIRRLFGVPLLLLGGLAESEFPDEILKQADVIKAYPMFQPRGHYTDSNDLQRYSLAMQYLSKATIDVSVDKRAFPFPPEMLFPFETAVSIQSLFQDPANKNLLAKWLAVHSFYSAVNGPADSPTIKDLVQDFRHDGFDKKEVAQWAAKRGLPAINPERGLGIQLLGERFSLHQGVIDEFKRKLVPDGASQEEMAEILKFKHLMAGRTRQRERIKGLGPAASKDKGSTYYDTAIRAISQGAKGRQSNRSRMNFFAAAITSLAEQTALMTKTSIMVEKSLPSGPTIPNGVKLFFEPGSERFLTALAKASESMIRTCARLKDQVGGELDRGMKIEDPSPGFRHFAGLALTSQPLVTGSPAWTSYGRFVTELARNPAITVDVFQLQDRSGKMHFYQWAVAPFEAAYPGNNRSQEISGMEMAFFEAWSDRIVPGSEGPLTNMQWEQRIKQGELSQLPSLIQPQPERRPLK